MIVMAQLQDFCSPDTPEAIKYVKKHPYRGILTGSTIFKKEVFDIIGYFREDIITGDVIDLTNRLKDTNITIKMLDYISCDRRIHNQNFGRSNQIKEYQDYVKCLRARLKTGANS